MWKLSTSTILSRGRAPRNYKVKEFTVVIRPGEFEKVMAWNMEDILRCYPVIDSIFYNGIKYYQK